MSDSEVENSEMVDIDSPKGWTKIEKLNLLRALKAFGPDNINQILLVIPSKTRDEISSAISFYRRKAMVHPEFIEKNKSKKIIQNISRVPLAIWAKYLINSSEYKDLQTETATAVRLIADLEDIALPTFTGNIDFRMIYHIIANAMEGKAIPNDPIINSLIEKCIVESAYTSKVFIQISALRSVLNSVDIKGKDIIGFPKPTKNNQLATLRHLASQRKYNPLNISEDFLKPSFHQTSMN